MTAEALGSFAYGLNYRNTAGGSNPASLWDINIATGAATNQRFIRADAGGGVFVNDRSVCDIALGPDGVFYVLDDHYAGSNSDPVRLKDTLVSINPATGLVTRIGDIGFYVYEGDLSFQPGTGVLYACQSVNHVGTLYTINTATGAGTVINSTMSIDDASGMAFAPDGSLYILDTGAGGTSNPPAELHKLDPTTGGILSTITTNLSLGNTAGMEFDPQTGALYVGDGDLYGTNSLYTLDIQTGVFTLVGPTGIPGGTVNMGGGLAGLVIVPEPTTIMLLGLGLLVGVVRRR